MVDIVGNCYAHFHVTFAHNYITGFKDAVCKYLLNTPDSSIRLFDKDKVELIYSHMELLLKRLHTIPEKNGIMEEFKLAFSLRLFKSKYLDRRIQGLRCI